MTRYIFCVIAVLVQPLFVWYVYHKQDKREAALKIPMIGCSVLYLVVQIYAFFKLCIKIPGKYGIFSYLIQAVILAVFIVLELALSGSNKYIKRVQENEQNSIRDFKNLIKELEICRLDVSEENKKYIDKLYEKMRYSDPVSSPEVAQENEKIHELIAELPGITESSQFEAKCLEIEKQLDIRKIKNTKEQGSTMEAIKCPNCGSEKVKELTEEKYACLACDNIFLVHNLSKEFRQTDAHITDMHEDINEKLDNLSKNVNSVTINSNAQASRAKEILIEAQDNFDRGKYCEAYAGFKKYTGFEPDSCVGYEGMYKVILKLKGNTSTEKDKYAGYDLLNKMISCKDCDKEAVLTPMMQQYVAEKTETESRNLKNEVNNACAENGIKNNGVEDGIKALIEFYEKQKDITEKQYEKYRESSIKDYEKYSAMSDEEKKKKKLLKLIPPVIIGVISLIFLHGFFRWVVVIIAVIWAWLSTASPVKWDDDSSDSNKWKDSINSNQTRADYWKTKEERLNDKEEFTISDMEAVINDISKSCSSSDEIIENERIKQEDDISGYWIVEVGHGALESVDSSLKAREAVEKYCKETGIYNIHEPNNVYIYYTEIRIKKIRKSQAVTIQKLIQSYGIQNVNIRQMSPNEL